MIPSRSRRGTAAPGRIGVNAALGSALFQLATNLSSYAVDLVAIALAVWFRARLGWGSLAVIAGSLLRTGTSLVAWAVSSAALYFGAWDFLGGTSYQVISLSGVAAHWAAWALWLAAIFAGRANDRTAA
jgi:hypothetical protein